MKMKRTMNATRFYKDNKNVDGILLHPLEKKLLIDELIMVRYIFSDLIKYLRNKVVLKKPEIKKIRRNQ